LALELLEPDDRRLILLREYQSLTFADAAAKMGCSLKAAQMRWPRALARLARKIEELTSGGLRAALGETAGGEDA
jgi:DNA-directed RNA polymerase specialized sigma24 family protein